MELHDPNRIGPKVNLEDLLAKLQEKTTTNSTPQSKPLVEPNTVDTFQRSSDSSSGGGFSNQPFGGFMKPFGVEPGFKSLN
ncbi:MAG: hypothetical protein SFU25_03455 [Candidatus Caenarcaniphilales bacterium]|nr:hypothetical protein [Candidatus Caenarcaniphilales bacterium]